MNMWYSSVNGLGLLLLNDCLLIKMNSRDPKITSYSCFCLFIGAKPEDLQCSTTNEMFVNLMLT